MWQYAPFKYVSEHESFSACWPRLHHYPVAKHGICTTNRKSRLGQKLNETNRGKKEGMRPQDRDATDSIDGVTTVPVYWTDFWL